MILDGAEHLVRSACSSNVRRARALLEADAAIARADLACACVCGDAGEITRRLGHDPRAVQRETGPMGWPPILYACFSRLGRVDAERARGLRAVVDVLLAAGADADARWVNSDGWVQSTLYGAAGIAGDAVLTATLLAAGADPDDDSAEHRVGEALYHACEVADPECARLLIAGGTRQSAVDFCLLRALDFPRVAMVRVFCDGGARPGAAHLEKAVVRRRGANTVALLLDAGAPVEGDPRAAHTPLALAVRSGQQAVASLLTVRGADPGRVHDEDRVLAACLAGGDREPPVSASELAELLEGAIDLGDADTATRLLDLGAHTDGAGADRMPPLQVAAWRGHAEICAELVRRGAALSFSDGGTAVGAALHGLRHCADPQGGPTMATIDEIDPERYRETVTVLLAAGAPEPERIGERGPRAVRLLAELGLEG